MSLIDEHSPLVGSSAGPNRLGSREGSSSGGNNCNRLYMLILLGGLVGIGIYFQSVTVQLKQEIVGDEKRIDDLEHVIESQASIIQRFNDSVSNSDVLARLKSIESSLHETQTQLEQELKDTKQKVDSELADTLATLDETVLKAENQITSEVEAVKKDFEQYVITTQDQFSIENNFMVYQIAGTFTLLSCLISMWHMTSHLRKLRQPAIQRKILAILWMSPIYAITSWFSLVFHSAEGYLAIVKDSYEAYIIYQFLSFCIAVLGKGDREKVVDLLSKRADHLTPPFRLFGLCCKNDPYENDRALADAILLQCQFFALQFVFFRPLTTIATVMLNKFEYYGPFGAESANDYRAPQIYVAMIQNISIFTAFTGLLKFYHAVDKDLAWCRPFAKFLCIKGVVFMTFWQGLAITILAETTDVGGGESEEWATSAQNFLICLEMLLFSIAHFYCFPVEEWEPNYQSDYAKGKFGDSMALGDFLADLKLIMRSNSQGKRRKKKVEPSQPTVPEEDEEESTDRDIEQAIDEIQAINYGRTGVDSVDGTSVISDVTDQAGGPDVEQILTSEVDRALHDSGDEERKAAALRVLDGLSFGLTSYNQRVDGDDNSSSYAEETPDLVDADNSGKDSPDEASGLLYGEVSSRSSQDLRPSYFTTLANTIVSSPKKDNNTDSGYHEETSADEGLQENTSFHETSNADEEDDAFQDEAMGSSDDQDSVSERKYDGSRFVDHSSK